jgi:hypothetical protein
MRPLPNENLRPTASQQFLRVASEDENADCSVPLWAHFHKTPLPQGRSAASRLRNDSWLSGSWRMRRASKERQSAWPGAEPNAGESRRSSKHKQYVLQRLDVILYCCLHCTQIKARHDNLLNMAHFLYTETEPRLVSDSHGGDTGHCSELTWRTVLQALGDQRRGRRSDSRPDCGGSRDHPT